MTTRPRHFKRRFRKAGKRKPMRRFQRSPNQKSINPTSSIIKFGLGFPKKCMTTLKYREAFGLTSAAGVEQNYLFRANSLFDPNSTGAGHKPMYTDQFLALYNHYVVIGSKCTFKFTPSVTNPSPYRVVAFINDDATTTGTVIDTIAENSQARRLIMCPQADNNLHSRTLTWSAKKWFGGSILANTELQGTSTTNPSEVSFFQFALQADGGSNVTLALEVEIEYIVIFKELKDVASS